MNHGIHLIFLIFFFWIGLSVHAQDNKEKAEFEAVFGKGNSDALTKLVEEFENSLQIKYYTNLGVAYQSYLSEIKSGVWPEIWDDEKKNHLVKKYFGETGIWNEIWLRADSMWMDDKSCYCEYSYKGHSLGTRSYFTKGIRECDCGIIQNKYGLYFEGLKAASAFDINVCEYLDAIEIAGMTSPSLLAGGLFHNNEKYYENYCIKRIILLDIYLQGYVWE